jgi:hypothetical protein
MRLILALISRRVRFNSIQYKLICIDILYSRYMCVLTVLHSSTCRDRKCFTYYIQEETLYAEISKVWHRLTLIHPTHTPPTEKGERETVERRNWLWCCCFSSYWRLSPSSMLEYIEDGGCQNSLSLFSCCVLWDFPSLLIRTEFATASHSDFLLRKWRRGVK